MNFVKIKDYPYVIHPCGTILRIWKDMTKEIKKRKNTYMYVSLFKNCNEKKFLVHRLLSIAFIPNPENKPEVDHINGVKVDNRLVNLKWATKSENQRGFRKDRGVYKDITKGGIYKRKNGTWEWRCLMSGKQKVKYMKSKTDLEKFRKEKLAEYNIYVDV